MDAIHSTKLSGNFGPKLNGSVRSNRKSFEKKGPPFEVVLVFPVGPLGILVEWIAPTDCVHKNSFRYTQSAVRGPQSTRYTSLLTDALFSLQSQSSAGDKIQTAGDLLTASARG